MPLSHDDNSDSRRRLAGIVESAMDAIITIDERQTIILFNPAAEHMFGIPADQALGRPITDFIPERFRSSHDGHIRRFRETGVTTRKMGALGAVSGLRASGEEFPVEASISQVEVGGERLSTVILRDITERKLSEEARVLLAREVDHRAKNALAVAQSLIKLTKGETKEDYIAAVQGRMSALVRAHSLLSQGRWQGADLAETIGDELELYVGSGQAHVAGPSVTLAANAVQPVSMVVHELATNAIKHGALREAEGAVHLHWRRTREGDLLLEWEELGGQPVTPPARSGFGSTLLREVVTKQLGGALDLDWRREGLRASVAIPPTQFRLEQNASPPIAQRPAPSPIRRDLPAGLERRVLVVEDESLIALELKSDLTRCGWTVVGPAQSLQEGLAVLESDAAIDAAVLDVNLAGRAVYPLATLLQDRGTPFVFCTGYGMVDPEGRFPSVPILRKPVNVELLDRQLEQLIAS
jgi:PAS domain S-box-containing protein